MRKTAIALSLGLGLGLCSLPSLATTLAEQFTLMEKGADYGLDTRRASRRGRAATTSRGASCSG